MGRSYDHVPDHLATWMEAQPIWFVASAPLAADGHVNVSPKGDDTFRVLGPNLVGYLDRVGSGAETIAHLRENGRCTIMFTSFDEAPNIVRLYGQGTSILPGAARWAELAPRFPERLGARSIVLLDVETVTTSCGYGVPLMRYEGTRPHMDDWAEKKGPEGIAAYLVEKNATSIDGLPAIDPAGPATRPG